MNIIKATSFAIALGVMFCLCKASDSAKSPSLQAAAQLFRQGKFADAETLYAEVESKTAPPFQALVNLGAIALYKNELETAEQRLKRALKLEPASAAARRLLVDVYYRRDDFAKAASVLHSLGDEAAARKLESFKDAPPYAVDQRTDVVRVPFVITDPLPLIEAKINGEPVNLLIDTGAAELYIDPAVAKKAAARQFGTTTGEYAGGAKATTVHGRIDTITLGNAPSGNAVVRNVPVHILSTRRFSAAARGKRVDGILGTAVLFHFLPTLDYPRGELVLRRKTRDQLRNVEQETKKGGGTAIPFWMAGDHFLVAWGRVNHSPPLLFFVDTGLSGGGFVCPAATLKEAGIPQPHAAQIMGQGGGGKVIAVPFMVQDLSLGSVEAHQIQAFAGVFPPSLEYGEGFRIAGIVSHQFFRPYALTFDFQGMRLFLTPGKA